MGDVLGHVISSTSLDEPVEAEAVETCPRVLLKLACLKGSTFPCMCQMVEGARIKTVRAPGRERYPVTTLTLRLKPEVSDATELRKMVALAGFKATWTESARAGLEWVEVEGHKVAVPKGAELRAEMHHWTPTSSALLA